MSSRKRKAVNIAMDMGETEETKCQASPSRSSIQQQSIMELPSHVNMEILSRLPIKTLLKCRCVCKTWKTLLSAPHFVKLHFSRAPMNLLCKTIPQKRESRQLRLIDLGGAKTRCSRDAKLKLTMKTNLPSNGNAPITLLDSCNGLLSLGDSETNEPLFVCNPIIGEYIAISKPHKGMTSRGVSGIGLCSNTNQYKVLRYLRAVRGDAPPATYEVEIFSLGEGNWKSIGKPPDGLAMCSGSTSPNAYVNGALHWVTNGSKDKHDDYVQSFHFGTEQFRVIPPPADFGRVYFHNYLRLGELHGCLYLLDNDKDSSKVEVWIMNDYGIQESWSKKFVINNFIPERKYCDIFEPLMVFDDGEILFIYNDFYLMFYNPYSEDIRYLNQTYGIRSEFQAIVHVPSFLSLKDVAKGEILKVCRA